MLSKKYKEGGKIMLTPNIGNNGINMEINNNLKNNIKEIIFNNLQNITINIIGEDCNEKSNLQEFLNILENYVFTQDELTRLSKNKKSIILRLDDDYLIELKIN